MNSPSMSEAESDLWKALGQWSIELVTGGEHAELAPPQYLIDAIAALVALGKKHD